MIFETVITSVPRGLKAGRTGFQPVMRTSGLRDDLLNQLGPLAGYRHVHRQGSGQNPVIFSYRRLSSNIGDLAVIGRTVDAGSDFSNRSNKCGHLIAFTADELGRLSRTTPAAILAGNTSLFADQWTRGPEERPTPPALAEPPQEPAVCALWQQQFGDAGWAGLVAERARRRQPTMLVAPDCTPQSSELLLGLIREATALLSPGERWAVSFETTVLASSDSLIQGTYRGSPEAEAPRPGMLVLPLGGPLPQIPLEETALCKLARFGKPRPATPQPPSVTAAAPPAPTGDDFLGGDLPSPAQGSPPPLQPKKTGWQSGSFEPLPEDKRVPWGTIIGASLSFLLILLLAGWYAWTTVSATITARRDAALKRILSYADLPATDPNNVDAAQPPPDLNTWRSAGLTWQLNAQRAERLNFFVRLSAINANHVNKWIDEPAANFNSITAILDKPFSNFSITDFQTLGVLDDAPEDGIASQLKTFLTTACSDQDSQSLDFANELSEVLTALSNASTSADEHDGGTTQHASIETLLRKCRWTFRGKPIWPIGEGEDIWAPGYITEIVEEASGTKGPEFFQRTRKLCSTSLRHISDYRKTDDPKAKTPTATDYRLVFGKAPTQQDLSYFNRWLHSQDPSPAPIPTFSQISEGGKKLEADERSAAATAKRKLAAERRNILEDLDRRRWSNGPDGTFTLGKIQDLHKLGGLTPEAFQLQSSAEPKNKITFERKDTGKEKKQEPHAETWVMSYAEKEIGTLTIDPREGLATLRPSEQAPPATFLTPIRLSSPHGKTSAKPISTYQAQGYRYFFTDSPTIGEITTATGEQGGQQLCGIRKKKDESPELSDILTNLAVASPRKAAVEISLTTDPGLSGSCRVIKGNSGTISIDGISGKPIWTVTFDADPQGIRATWKETDAEQRELIASLAESKTVIDNKAIGREFYNICIKLLGINTDEAEKDTLKQHLIKIFNHHDPEYHPPQDESIEKSEKPSWKDVESLISVSRRKKHNEEPNSKWLETRFDVGDNNLEFDTGNYKPKPTRRSITGIDKIDDHLARGWEAILRMYLAKTSVNVNEGNEDSVATKNIAATKWVFGKAKDDDWISREVETATTDPSQEKSGPNGFAPTNESAPRRTAAKLLECLTPTIEAARKFSTCSQIELGMLVEITISAKFIAPDSDPEDRGGNVEVALCKVSAKATREKNTQ